jgi:hypothetical protein
MDVTAIQGLIASLKTAADIAKTIFDLKSTAEVQGKVIEIQSALLAAQNSALSATTAQFELQERVRELEAQQKASTDWDVQKVRYALVAPWGGAAQVYALKESHSEGEKPHFVCTNCFHNRKRIILNPMSNKEGWLLMVCPTCKGSLETGYRGVGPAEYAEKCDGQG